MDMEIFFRILFAMIILVVAMGVGADVLKRSQSHKERMLELKGDKTAEKAAQYVAQIERLEQRTRVLERIATDRGADLALEIEDLRGPAAQPVLQAEKLQ